MPPAVVDSPPRRFPKVPRLNPGPAAPLSESVAETLRLGGVSRAVYEALRDRPGRGGERLRFDPEKRGGLLEIALPDGPPADVTPVPVGDWRETFVRLHEVPWSLYRELRHAGDDRRVRMTYYRRTLELEVVNGTPHEFVRTLLTNMVALYALARDIDTRPSGSATWWPDEIPGVAPDDLHGLEGDETFHIRSFETVRGRGALSVAAGDPPPDLAVEVVFSSPLNGKEIVYAALGVGELWVWRDDALNVSTLADGAYAPADDSPNLPGFPFALAADLIARRDELGQTELLRRFRGALISNDG